MKVLIHRAFQVAWLVVFSLETYLLLAEGSRPEALAKALELVAP